jgi:hypothetical protein
MMLSLRRSRGIGVRVNSAARTAPPAAGETGGPNSRLSIANI